MGETKHLSQDELFELFESEEKHIYAKKGRYLFRVVVTNTETVLTIVSGKLETMKVAKYGDVIVRNINIGGSAETYVLDGDKFEERYEMIDGLHLIDGKMWQEAQAKGKVEAFQYLDPDPLQFKAPWGEDMMCHCEDYIARPVPSDAHDIYRIELDTFRQTYGEEVATKTAVDSKMPKEHE